MVMFGDMRVDSGSGRYPAWNQSLSARDMQSRLPPRSSRKMVQLTRETGGVEWAILVWVCLGC